MPDFVPPSNLRDKGVPCMILMDLPRGYGVGGPGAFWGSLKEQKSSSVAVVYYGLQHDKFIHGPSSPPLSVSGASFEEASL